MVSLTGLNDTSREFLTNRRIIIRHFPFRIGRFSLEDPFFSLKQDLSIPDNGPYRLSREHLSIERNGDQIVLVDEKSRLGSVVNKRILGKRAGGESRIALEVGKNQVILGGGSSPFRFEMEVLKSDQEIPSNNYVRCGESIVDVAVLYARLCLYAKDILTSSGGDPRKRILSAMDSIGYIIRDPETIDMLYCYSAHPDTYSDVIVAHSVNVAIYSLKFFASLSYPEEDIIRIGTAALLHDIGMYDIPEEIVYKRKQVTDTEYGLIKQHTVAGNEKLMTDQDDHGFYSVVALDHHERIDGSGYPKGLRDIPDFVEFLGLLDFFEAVTHQRPQRGPVTPHRGIQIILGLRNGVFSPRALKAIIHVFSVFPAYSVIRLNSGEIGQVVKIHTNWPLRPIVRVLFGEDGQLRERAREVDLLHDRDLYITRDISDRIFVDRYFKL